MCGLILNIKGGDENHAPMIYVKKGYACVGTIFRKWAITDSTYYEIIVVLICLAKAIMCIQRD